MSRDSQTHDLIGLDVGSSIIRIAAVRSGIVFYVGERALPDGIIVDGALVDPAAFTRQLVELRNEVHLPVEAVNFSLRNAGLIVRTLTIPATSDEDVSAAVELNVDTVLEAVDRTRATIDYHELSRPDGTHVQMQIAAADTELVQAFTDAISASGLNPVACEIGPLAQTRALVVPFSERTAHLIVDIGADTTSVAAANGPDVAFLRMISLGGDDFTRAIAQALQMSLSDAEQLKRRCGMQADPVDETVDRDLFNQAQEAMLPVMDELLAQIAGARSFYQAERDGRAVTGFSLLGGGGRLAGTDHMISAQLGLPAEPLAARRRYTGASNVDLYATALGLAAGPTMSLIPPSSRRRSGQMQSKLAARAVARRASRRRAIIRRVSTTGGAALVLIAAQVGWAMHMNAQTDSLQAQTRARAARVTTIHKPGYAPLYSPAGLDTASRVSQMLGAQPGPAAYQLVDQVLQTPGLGRARVTTSGAEVTITLPQSGIDLGQQVMTLLRRPDVIHPTEATQGDSLVIQFSVLPDPKGKR